VSPPIHDIPPFKEVFQRFEYPDVILPARFYLQEFINQKFQTLSHRGMLTITLLLNDKNLLETFSVTRDILPTVWYQFSQFICGERRLKRCRVCNKWTDVSENRSSWKQHPDCGNRERVRRYYREKKKREQAEAAARKEMEG
jgi:hypothetical protein